MREAVPQKTLLDAHCHMAFIPHAMDAAKALEREAVRAFSCTVDVREYNKHILEMCGMNHVVVGLGLHPWRFAGPLIPPGLSGADCTQGDSVITSLTNPEIQAFYDQAYGVRLIGEVGLDASRAHVHTLEIQRAFLKTVVDIAVERAQKGERLILSLHAVGAAHQVLDICNPLDDLNEQVIRIFHWFSGTGEDLVAARDRGYWFSVGPRMLATKRGRAYAHQLPLDRTVLETDTPSYPGQEWSAKQQRRFLDEASDALQALHKQNDYDVLDRASHILWGRAIGL